MPIDRNNPSYVGYLEALDGVSRAALESSNLDELGRRTLDVLLSAFDAGRAWLQRPGDPKAETWRMVCELGRPGAAAGRPLPPELAVTVPLRSRAPWRLGLSPASPSRAWTETERSLLQEIASRLGCALSTLLACQELRDSEEKYRILMDRAADAIFLTDTEGHIHEANLAAAEMFGRERSEFSTLMVPALHPPRDRAQLADTFREIVEQGRKNLYEWEILRKDGGTVPVDIRASLIALPGENVVLGIMRDITERKRSEAALAKAQALFTALIEQSSAGIIAVDAEDLRYRVVNAAAMEILGTTDADPLVGQPLLSPRPWRSLSPSGEFLPQEASPLARALSEGRDFHNVLQRVQRTDGTERWVLVNASPVRDEMGSIQAAVSVFADITGLKATEEKLEQEKDHLAVTLRSIGDGVISCDPQGRVTLMNGVAETLTGWTQKEAAGHSILEVMNIVSERTREPRENPTARVLATGEIVELANHTLLINRRDLSERAIADSAAPIWNREGQIIGVVLVFRDVTEKETLQRELQRTQKLDSLGVLAGGIAHDFNNILTAITGYISLVKDEFQEGTTGHRFATQAENAAAHARELTTQLLTFAKGGAPVKESASIQEIIQASAGFSLRGSNVELNMDLAEDLWPVEVDRGQISQVIQNIIINADHAMPEGGKVSISARNTPIIEDNPQLRIGDYLKITIQDAGVGIHKEHLAKIFDPYFTTKQKGSGLGLAIVHSIIAKHDGHIVVDSILGEGTTFTIFLPAAKEVTLRRGQPSETLLFGKGKVLVMDDELLVRDVAMHILTKHGFQVELACDGAEAIEKYAAAQKAGDPFDVIILDLTVPGGMGGKEAARLLRELDSEAQIIASSGYSSDPVMSDFRAHGFSAVLPKPYSHRELSAALGAVLLKV